MTTTRLQEHYEKVVRPALMAEFKYENPFAVPRLEKIVLNMGVGEAVNDSKKTQQAAVRGALLNQLLAEAARSQIKRQRARILSAVDEFLSLG